MGCRWPHPYAGPPPNSTYQSLFSSDFSIQIHIGFIFLLSSTKLPARSLLLICALLLAIAGCERKAQFDNPVDSLHSTTNGGVVLSNLDNDIAHWQAQLAKGEGRSLSRYARLSHALLLRATLRLRIDDYQQALSVTEQAAKQWPNDADAWILRASALSAVHQYAKAQLALNTAADLIGDPTSPTASLLLDRQCKLERARGNYTTVLRCAGDAVTAAPSASSHGEYASLLAELGEHDDAQVQFTKAWAAYKQPSPIVPAWLALAHSKALQGADKPKAAAQLLTAMQTRLPQHLRLTVETAVALEAIGKRKQAIALLEPLLAQTDDPDVPNLLAAWYADAGETARATAMTSRAAKGFEDHMARLPAAYAAHAAEFWAGPGDDLEQALALAETNARNSPNVPALELLIDIGRQANALARACALVGQLGGSERHPECKQG